MKKVKFEKFFGNATSKWWDSLTDDQKRFYKSKYESIRNKSLLSKFPYPDLRDTSEIRLSKLSQKDIHCIWRFKDHKL